MVLDEKGERKRYENVFDSDCYNVIGDASPSVNQISLGTRVCVRDNQSMFVEGIVCTIVDGQPIRFVVAVIGKYNFLLPSSKNLIYKYFYILLYADTFN